MGAIVVYLDLAQRKQPVYIRAILRPEVEDSERKKLYVIFPKAPKTMIESKNSDEALATARVPDLGTFALSYAFDKYGLEPAAILPHTTVSLLEPA